MKKKLKIFVICVGVLLVFVAMVFAAYKMRYSIFYKKYELVCIGEIPLRGDIFFDGGFYDFSKEGFKEHLNDMLALDAGYIMDQQKVDELVAALDNYEDYPKVIISNVKSDTLWVPTVGPFHDKYEYGYISFEHLLAGVDALLPHDDVMYIYVTKCSYVVNYTSY